MMRKNIFICVLLLLFSISAWTQESVTVTGIVTDHNKEPLIGVNIAIGQYIEISSVIPA